MNESRTSKSIKNAQASLIYYFIQLLLGFFSRKVFFDYLGSEILGLNTTAANLSLIPQHFSLTLFIIS